MHALAARQLDNDLTTANDSHPNGKIVPRASPPQKKNTAPVSHHRSSYTTPTHSWPLEPPAVSFRGLSDHEYK